MQCIKMKTLSATPERSLQPEQVAVLPDDEALELIAKGYAVPVDSRGREIPIDRQELAQLGEQAPDGSAAATAADTDPGEDPEEENPAGDEEPTEDPTAEPVTGVEEPAEEETATTARRRRRSRLT